ncbi:putative house-cleaning noncanonical NTP pyrophosphatase (MazG superfamily) [Salsuginibacillus halophilus]|uniref:Putative house-cleaning noncanonical NTP pyrophosphatase (MazG superfamily) n=1 Tax=Salsuginibacillus halophilus TaxID=517424 RepID=A0A2P8H8L8_9BACI|nr:nucleoside triphosphate pyrophosphohydrolase [Salsuginibacillus halophilus]PSL42562.1 putative house-cleaning noncanonical NTP pyrophosphatase (MazG superfamily) [Salsuginibacillus halophilus]
MPEYNKLVRDKIPEIIEASGKSHVTEVLSDGDYVKEAQKKLHEELQEYEEAAAVSGEEALDELADIAELLHALTYKHGADPEKLEERRQEKAEKRGGFQDKLFLVRVDDE